MGTVTHVGIRPAVLVLLVLAGVLLLISGRFPEEVFAYPGCNSEFLAPRCAGYGDYVSVISQLGLMQFVAIPIGVVVALVHLGRSRGCAAGLAAVGGFWVAAGAALIWGGLTWWSGPVPHDGQAGIFPTLLGGLTLLGGVVVLMAGAMVAMNYGVGWPGIGTSASAAAAAAAGWIALLLVRGVGDWSSAADTVWRSGFPLSGLPLEVALFGLAVAIHDTGRRPSERERARSDPAERSQATSDA